ncbi:hypothetical protein MBANPS3_000077 [Mucor bainieri]
MLPLNPCEILGAMLSNFIDYCELFKCCSEDYSLEMDKFYCIIIDMPSTTFSTIQFTSKDGEYFVKVCASATKYVYLRSDADDKISASTASAFADALSKEDTMRALTINCRDVKIFATLKDAYTIQ